MVFAGCGSVAVNKIYGSVTFPGVCVTWGLIVMVMIYSVGHISGAHFNPAVTIAFAIFRRFPYVQVSLSNFLKLGNNLAKKQRKKFKGVFFFPQHFQFHDCFCTCLKRKLAYNNTNNVYSVHMELQKIKSFLN